MNQLDYYDWCYRTYCAGPTGIDTCSPLSFDCTLSSAQPMYPHANSMESANGTPTILLQQPLASVHPHAIPVDYSSWCGSVHEYLGGAYYCDQSESMHRTQSKHPLRDISISATSANAPRFGPGPPIVTDDRVRGPRGCNLFVFHLPNEMTNW